MGRSSRPSEGPAFEVVVGNIGIVYAGSNYLQATAKFARYVTASKTGMGRAGDEPVAFLHYGEVARLYEPPGSRDA